MNQLIKHIILPMIAPIAVIGLYFTPVALFGCVNRGLMAIAVVLISLITSIFTIAFALLLKIRKDASSIWWIVSTLILILLCVLVFGPLG